ncbi:MAG: PorV/PorQ family protein [Candidatus Kapabacteria bacterium]|nr:PorV/PorQ family protein [Candidatus Kapabacteria bacterium]
MNKIIKSFAKFCLMFSFMSYIAFSADKDFLIGSSSGESFKKVGAAGAQFLKIGVGGRGSAMAGANSAAANDLSALFYNPAGIYQIEGTQAMFSYTKWFGGFTHNFAAICVPLGTQFKLAASMTNLTSGDIEITTLNRPEGTGAYYSINDVAIGLTFAGKLTEQFTFGLTAKYVSNAFYNVASTGFGVDVGTQYDTGIEGIKLGFSLHNLGSEMKYSGQSLDIITRLNNNLNNASNQASLLSYAYTMPITFRAGISGDLLKMDNSKLIGAFDFATLSDTPEQYAMGLEWEYDNLLFVRGGYVIGHDQFGAAGGIGLKYNSNGIDSRLDYSINPTSSFGLVNRLNFIIGFN